MDEFLSAARAFDERARNLINRFDLGAALLLERFAAPFLRHTKYTPLAARTIVRSLGAELEELSKAAPPFVISRISRVNDTDVLKQDFPEYSEAFTLIGHALDERRRAIESVHRISRLVAFSMFMIYVVMPIAIIRDVMNDRFIQAAIIFGVWQVAAVTATIVCRTNLHWRPHAGLRGSSC